MSAKDVENGDSKILHAHQNDIGVSQCATEATTAAFEADVIETAGSTALGAVPERTYTSEGSRTANATTTTMNVDENDSAASSIVGVGSGGGGGSAMSPTGSGRGDSRRPTAEQGGSDGSDKNNSKRKTRRGKTKRGKRSSSSRPYSKSQWKYHVPMLRTSAANKRRVKVSLGKLSSGRSSRIITTKDPFLLSDQPPLVPYNTNRFLMEDHMPHVLTPSEDEEEFLTKEFSSVYEDARSERLEGLSKSQLIQEYLQLEANYEQVMRRYNAVKSLSTREENESAVNNATTTASTKDATEGGAVVTTAPVSAVERRRLEDRIRELTAENLELRRQLEHASRLGMVLSAKSSPRSYGGPTTTAANYVERMDSSSCHGTSSEDSESDSSSSTSSSSSDNDDDSSSSMSNDDDDDDGDDGEDNNMAGDDREPLVVAMEGPDDLIIPNESNGYHQNGDDLLGEESMNNGPLSPLSGQSPPPPVVTN